MNDAASGAALSSASPSRCSHSSPGGEDVALAAEHAPDVILMDIRLPDADGTELAKQLKDDVGEFAGQVRSYCRSEQ
jgi:CheY-like chemotaxis protein